MGDKIAKVSLNGQTLIDISEDSVTPEVLAEDETAHDAAGEPIRGTAQFGGDTTDCYKTTDPASTDIADNDYIPFNDVSDSEEPKKKTLFSNIKEKLKSMFSWFFTQSDGLLMVWNAKVGDFWGQIKLDRSNQKIRFNWSTDGGTTWHGDIVLQNALTFDNVPTENSNNPVKSSGIFSSLITNVGTAIPANSDLNNYTTGGNFYIIANATAATVSNVPIASSGKLLVLVPDTGTRVTQIYITNKDNVRMYIRACDNNLAWEAWKEFTTTGNISNILQDKTQYLDGLADNDHKILYTDDLDDFTDAGTYQYVYNSNGLPANCPLSNIWSFKLIVDRYSSDSRSEIMQRITMQNTNQAQEMDWYRVRNWNTNTWNHWYQTPSVGTQSYVADTSGNIVLNWGYGSDRAQLKHYIGEGKLKYNYFKNSAWRGDLNIADYNDLVHQTFGIGIPDNADLNDYKTNGIYNVISNARAATISNLPVANIAGKLIVMHVAENNYVKQIYFVYSPSSSVGELYIRSFNGYTNTWTDWEDYTKGNMYVGTCSTAADQRSKVATVDGNFVLRKGVRIAIKFTNTNTYSSSTANPITLNVNNTGAKNIWYGSNHTGASGGPTGTANWVFGSASRYCHYVYDGTYWVWDGSGTDNNSTNFLRNDAQSTMTCATPFIYLKASDVDTKQSNNGVSSTVYPTFSINDKNGYIITRMESVVETNGNITNKLYAENYNSSGEPVSFISINLRAKKDGTSEYVFSDPHKLNRNTGFGYEVCNTAAATAAKVITMTNYKLVANSYVSIRFANDVPANATLNINSQGAKSISYRNALITAGKIKAGDVATFIYDGIYYRLVGIDRWGGDETNLCTDSSTQIIWSPYITNNVESITTGTSHFYMQSDHLLYVSVECTFKNSTQVTLPAYFQDTENVFFRFENSRLSVFNGVYSEVMVDLNGAIYPAWAQAGKTINNKKYLFVALRKGATLPAVTSGNIRFTFTIMVNYN